jgi:hypothetical protein
MKETAFCEGHKWHCRTISPNSTFWQAGFCQRGGLDGGDCSDRMTVDICNVVSWIRGKMSYVILLEKRGVSVLVDRLFRILVDQLQIDNIEKENLFENEK